MPYSIVLRTISFFKGEIMKKFCVSVVTAKGKIIPTSMSIEFEPTENREGKATLWCEKCPALEGIVSITKTTKKYTWVWEGKVIGNQNHHVLVNISTPNRKETH